MTYRELLVKLLYLNEEQLDQELQFYDVARDQFIDGGTSELLTDPEIAGELSDPDGRPFITIVK